MEDSGFSKKMISQIEEKMDEERAQHLWITV